MPTDSVLWKKNRIENFARIAQRSAGQIDDLLATLFRIEEFADFTSNFNQSIDAYLRLTTPQATELSRQDAVNERARLQVATEAEKRAALDLAATNLAEAYQAGLSYPGLLALIGQPQAPGRLQELGDLLMTQLPAEIGLTRLGAQEALDQLRRQQRSREAGAAALAERAKDLSFRDLFAAVASLQQHKPDRCPTCETPLDAVAINPYERAEAGLRSLAQLADLEAEQDRISAEVLPLAIALHGGIETAAHYARESALEAPSLIALADAMPVVGEIEQWALTIDPAVLDWDEVLRTAAAAEESDVALRQRAAARASLRVEYERLTQASLDVTTHQGAVTSLDGQLAAAHLQLQQFDESTADLRERVRLEAEALALDSRIKAGYEEFLRELERYRASLPAMLLENLNDATMELYNSFNEGDDNADKLHALHLPLRNTDRIEIETRGSPGVRVDALMVLSEGHLRCLGLALLVAKNIELGLPFLIFDDAVNAVDDDHRRGLRNTLCNTPALVGKQLIVTCHSPEFLKDLQNQLPQGSSKLYVIRPHAGDFHPRINGNAETRSYLALAQNRLEERNDREALAQGRRALEFISRQLWDELGKGGHGTLKLIIYGPERKPELRGLVEQIRSKIGSNAVAEPRRSQLLVPLDTLLSIGEKNLIWDYLNRGTHEEIDQKDFDHDEVATVVTSLTVLNGLLRREGR